MTDNAIVVRDDAHLTTRQILDGLHTVKSVLAPDLSDDELRLFAMVANRSGLDPFAKQIYAVKRGKRRSPSRPASTATAASPPAPACTTARTSRSTARPAAATGRPAGHPEYATVRVYRKGVGRAIAATAYWHESPAGRAATTTRCGCGCRGS